MSQQGPLTEEPSRSDISIKKPDLPPLFLHIGRGKSGSSTIQSLARDFVDFMTAMGVACPLTVDGLANHARLAVALKKPKSDIETIKAFRRDVRRNKRKKIFFSAEALFSLSTDAMKGLRRHAGDREIRVICYIRDYPSWLQSIYGQRTKRAINVENFDAYYQAVRPSVSALPALYRWAEEFGWERMHVRPLQPDALADGNLVSDVLHALGLNCTPPDVESLNVAPHWMSLELQRALAAAAKSASVTFDLRSARMMLHLFEECTEGVEPRRVQYLTRDQWSDLAELYRADIKILGQHLDLSFEVDLKAPPERPFLPDFSATTEQVRNDVLKHLGTKRLKRLAPELIELLRAVLEKRA